MNSRHPLSKYVVVSTLILPLLMLVSPASSSDYLFSIAQEAKPDGDPRLCTSDHTGRAATYACQDYQTRDGLIRLLFSGGRMPKAIVRFDANEEVADIVHVGELSGQEPTFDVVPPPGVPQDVVFLGATVCVDERDQSLPCSVFRHAAVGQPTVRDYMVFYGRQGGVARIQVFNATVSHDPRDDVLTFHPLYVDQNHDAASAQMAYETGLALLDNGCCRSQALSYLRYACELFPGAAGYCAKYHTAS